MTSVSLGLWSLYEVFSACAGKGKAAREACPLCGMLCLKLIPL